MATDYPIPAAPLEVSEEIKKSRFGYPTSPTRRPSRLPRPGSARSNSNTREPGITAGLLSPAPQDSQVYGFSDDGEPRAQRETHAGPVDGAGLGEVAAVVVRYYGGVLLGTGGLVKAYGGGGGSTQAT